MFGSSFCLNRLGFTDALQGLANKLFPTLFPENYARPARKNFTGNALQSDGIKRGSPTLCLENQPVMAGMKPDSGKRKKIEKGESDGCLLVDGGYKGRMERAQDRIGIERPRGWPAKMRIAAVMPYNGTRKTGLHHFTEQIRAELPVLPKICITFAVAKPLFRKWLFRNL